MPRKTLLLALLIAGAAVAETEKPARVFEHSLAPCKAPENRGQPHKWLSSGKLSEREPIDDRTPMKDCARRDRYKTCKYCLSTLITQVEYYGPRCPYTPPPGCE